MISFKQTGLEELIKEMDRIARIPVYKADVRVGSGQTTERVKYVIKHEGQLDEEKWKTVKHGRDSAENKKIAMIQKRKGRDPWFLGEMHFKRILEKYMAGIDYFIQKNNSAMLNVFGGIPELMVKAVRVNVQRGRSKFGRMTQLKERYRERKDRRYGMRLPILVASGQLYNSIFGKLRKTGR